MSEFSRNRQDEQVGQEDDPQRSQGWQAAVAGGGYYRHSVEEQYRDAAGMTREHAGKAREVASEYGQKAQEQLESGKHQAAGGIERAAERVRERTGAGGGMTAEAGAKVAEGMESAAGYLRERSTTEIWMDVEHYVREHPAQALAGAVVAGFLLGRILR